jgi:hypothetical protein
MSECSAWRTDGSILLPAPSGKAHSMSSSPTAPRWRSTRSISASCGSSTNTATTASRLTLSRRKAPRTTSWRIPATGYTDLTKEFSSADEAYDNAFEEAVGGGIGAWRLRAVYEDDEDDDDDRQRVSIEPIYDADSTVFFDLGAKRQDKSDAKRCYVLTSMTESEYEETWGDSPASWPKDITMTEFDWSAGDVVYVAELYKVEEVRHTVHIYTTLEGEEERYTDADFENDEMLEDTLMAIGTRKTGEKKTKKKKVHKYIMSGGAILEDCGYIAGQCIPIVMVYGKRWFVDNVERCMGHVRLAKDVQRLKNMQLSKLAEISALSTVEKPIMLPEQVAGYEMMWAEDNLRDYPYLLVNPITDATGAAMATGPIGYTKVATDPACNGGAAADHRHGHAGVAWAPGRR